MLRKVLCIGLMGILLGVAVPAAADEGIKAPAPPSKSRANSGSKRALWTIVGIGAGFGAGLLVGLHAFDDAIDSDRKVWMTALAGAAAGGVAGNLLGKNIGRSPVVTGGSAWRSDIVPDVSWEAARPAADAALRNRVRALSAATRRTGS
jgi:hypothetical protein